MRILSFILFSFLLIAACDQPTSDTAHTHDEAAHDHDHDHDHDHGDEMTSGVMLNDGQRWDANPETTEGIQNMQTLMTAFDPSASATAYVELQDALKAEFSGIFQKCTMTGEAHNQLHNYLLPMKDLILGLTDGESTNAEALAKLKAYLTTYSEYFA